MYFATFGFNSGSTPLQDFISTWKTDNLSVGSSTNTQIKLPLIASGTYNFDVNWGDGNTDTITAYNQAEVTHTYDNISTYTITIVGQLKGFKFNTLGDKLKILEVSNFGTGIDFSANDGYDFSGCNNLSVVATDSIVVSTLLGFLNAGTNYNDPLTWLDTSNVLEFDATFADCSEFNQDVSILDFSNATTLNSFLYACASFDQDLVLNTTGALINCSNMLYGCSVFNSDLDFDTSNVSSFRGMLGFCTLFNKTLSNLDSSSCTNFSYMLYGAGAFNQALPVDMSLATTTTRMCYASGLTTADLSNKSLTNLTDASYMFAYCPLTTINVTGVDLGSNPLTLQGFANGCTALTDIIGLDTLDISNVTDMTDFIKNSTIPKSRYSDALIYWATLTLQDDVVCNMGGTKYNSAGETAKNYIIATYNWTFLDGGLEV